MSGAPLSAPLSLKAPQSAYREDDRKSRRDTERDERPDEEEGSSGQRDAGGDAPFACHVDDRDPRRKERHDEDDDLPRPALGEQQSRVQPDGHDEHHVNIGKPSWRKSADDVVCEVKRPEQHCEKRTDDQQRGLLHLILLCSATSMRDVGYPATALLNEIRTLRSASVQHLTATFRGNDHATAHRGG